MSTGALQLTAGAGGAGVHRAAGLQPEGAAGVYPAAESALLHRGEVCPADRDTGQEEVSCVSARLSWDRVALRSPGCLVYQLWATATHLAQGYLVAHASPHVHSVVRQYREPQGSTPESACVPSPVDPSSTKPGNQPVTLCCQFVREWEQGRRDKEQGWGGVAQPQAEGRGTPIFLLPHG